MSAIGTGRLPRRLEADLKRLADELLSALETLTVNVVPRPEQEEMHAEMIRLTRLGLTHSVGLLRLFGCRMRSALMTAVPE